VLKIRQSGAPEGKEKRSLLAAAVKKESEIGARTLMIWGEEVISFDFESITE
jgi:hypothetical protein